MHTRVLLPRLAAAIAGLGAVAFFVANLARFFPNRVGGVGYDHEMFLPWMLATRYWQATNGLFAPPAFVASFCGGIPLLFNPQSMVFALPQWLSVVLPPVSALLVSWVVFGLGGGIGMYALLRRVFAVSRAAALLGATLFLLNGFYAARMIIGHVTYHGVMLLPALALALFPAGPVARAGVAGRAAVVAVMIGYLFYSGATNIILPMALMVVSLGLLLGYLGRWNRQTGVIAALGCGLAFGLCAWKFFPAMAYAAHVTRPVALRMTGNLASLVGGAVVSLFVPQVLAWLDPDHFVVDRVELEYGVGLVPLLVLLAAAWAATRRRGASTGGTARDRGGGGRTADPADPGELRRAGAALAAAAHAGGAVDVGDVAVLVGLHSGAVRRDRAAAGLAGGAGGCAAVVVGGRDRADHRPGRGDRHGVLRHAAV